MGIKRILVDPAFGGGGGGSPASTETIIRNAVGGVQEGITGTPTWPSPANTEVTLKI